MKTTEINECSSFTGMECIVISQRPCILISNQSWTRGWNFEILIICAITAPTKLNQLRCFLRLEQKKNVSSRGLVLIYIDAITQAISTVQFDVTKTAGY